MDKGVYATQNLYKSKYVWVRLDHMKPPLTAPYEGRFSLLQRFGKTFKILPQSKEINLTVDRQKPAFIFEYLNSKDVVNTFLRFFTID